MSMASRMPLARSSSFGAGSLGVSRSRKIESFSHSGVAVRDHRREEGVGAAEHLGLALEVHLAVLVEPVHVDRHAGIEDRVELVAVGAAEEQLHHLLHLLGRIDLRGIERRLQVVQLVRVGLLGEQRGAVVVLEGEGDRLAVVLEVEHEAVVLLRVRAVESRQGLHRLDARERLVHVHRVQQRLVVAGLELVGADQEAVRVGLDLARRCRRSRSR